MNSSSATGLVKCFLHRGATRSASSAKPPDREKPAGKQQEKLAAARWEKAGAPPHPEGRLGGGFGSHEENLIA